MNIPLRTGHKVEPTATSSGCKYVSLLNVKCTSFVHSVSILFISDFVIFTVSSPLS